MAIIAGAAAAAKFLKDNRTATPDEAIRHVSREISQIVENIEMGD